MRFDTSYCFVCGENNPKGLHIKVFYEGKIAKTRYIFSPEYQGWKGIIHGGLITTLLDEIMAYAAARETPAVTIHLNVTFRHALHPGEEVEVAGWIKNRSNRKIEAEAVMKRLADGKVIATAEGVLLQMKKIV
jgi:acyl-coenzyme A thioesterase PaaI-like protein